MVIEYQIKRFDLVKAYFYSLRVSRKTQTVILGIAAFIALFSLFLGYLKRGHLIILDFVFALLFGFFFILLLPFISLLTAKPQKRTLSISPDGIETRIGSQEGKVPWDAVKSVVGSKNVIYIIGKNGNAFTIPSSAFASPDLRSRFIELANQYHHIQ